MYKYFRITVLFLIITSTIQSQEITSPSDFLGYDIGTQFSRHHQVIDYFKHIAKEASDYEKLRNNSTK